MISSEVKKFIKLNIFHVRKCWGFFFSSPPHSPPPFKKTESRFEREQKIKVGSVDAYKPGSGAEGDPDRDKSVFCHLFLMTVNLLQFKRFFLQEGKDFQSNEY